MDAPKAGTGKTDARENPLFRIAHLHGSEWVALRLDVLQPEGQHSPSEDERGVPWADATFFRCDSCHERVIVAPA
jgi:hypothetical protein